MLLIAPLRVCHLVWPAEQQKWTEFNGFKVVVLHGPKKDELLKTDADIYVINPEGLEWLLQVEKTKSERTGKTQVTIDRRRWKALGFSILVIDELSKFRYPQTVRFKSLKLVLDTFQRRWGLTGSPASNGLMGLFGQVFTLDMGRTFGPYITHYRMKYFSLGRDGFSWKLNPGAEELIYERLAPLALRMSADDYLDMPDLMENIIKVELPKEARDAYDAMEDDLIAAIEKRVVVAGTAGIASMKCRQIASGGVIMTPDLPQDLVRRNTRREHIHLHTAKIEALRDLVDELQGQPLLVAYEFRHDLERLQLAFGKDLPYIGGGSTMQSTKELERAWNRGELPIMAVHPQAAGHGLNLQEVGQHVCWHTLTYDYELYDQLIRRVFRQGNKHKRVFVHHIIATDTIDEVVMKMLRSKRKNQNALFDALSDYAKGRKRINKTHIN